MNAELQEVSDEFETSENEIPLLAEKLIEGRKEFTKALRSTSHLTNEIKESATKLSEFAKKRNELKRMFEQSMTSATIKQYLVEAEKVKTVEKQFEEYFNRSKEFAQTVRNAQEEFKKSQDLQKEFLRAFNESLKMEDFVQKSVQTLKKYEKLPQELEQLKKAQSNVGQMLRNIGDEFKKTKSEHREALSAITALYTLRNVQMHATQAQRQIRSKQDALIEASRVLSVSPFEVAQRTKALEAELFSMASRLTERTETGDISGDALLTHGETIGSTTVVIREVPDVEPNLMRQLIDQVRGKTSSSAVLLASRQGDDKLTLVAGISKDLQGRKLSAGEWIRPVAAAVGGGGGGRPDLAQAGGKMPAKLPEALQIAKDTIRRMLGQA